ncbi:MAG: hypothetical protein R3C18_02520 [Planctomycetaceae bacterium]|jgi:hypothetical protein
MNTIRTSTLLLVATLSGCASAYHCYEGCGVTCKYCPPAPLSYTQYCGAPCHSSAAEPYLHPMAATYETRVLPAPMPTEAALPNSELKPAELPGDQD